MTHCCVKVKVSFYFLCSFVSPKLLPKSICSKGYGPTASLGDQHAMVSNVFLDTTLPQRFNPPTIFDFQPAAVQCQFNASTHPSVSCCSRVLVLLGQEILSPNDKYYNSLSQINSAVFPLQLFSNPLQSIFFF